MIQKIKDIWNNNLFEVILVFMLFVSAVFLIGVKEYKETNCHYEYPFNNTLQHDINRKLVCKGDNQ